MRRVAWRRLALPFLVGCISVPLGDLYSRLHWPHPAILLAASIAAAYGLVWAVVEVWAWLVLRRMGPAARTKIIGGRIGGSPNDHGAVDTPNRSKV